jgi:hypothetical protein
MITYRGKVYVLVRLFLIMLPLPYCTQAKPCADCFATNAWERR